MTNGIRSTVVAAVALLAVAADWPQWMGPKRDDVWTETGLLAKVLWRTKIAGGYAGPAVADGRVYVTDFLTETDLTKAGDPMKAPALKGQERILCLDAAKGTILWTHAYDAEYKISYPAGPRCTPTVSGGKVYALGAMGHLVCLDAAKGTLLWEKDFIKDFGAKAPMWGFCGHPLVVDQIVYCVVGGQKGMAVALDKDTGKEIWWSLPKGDQGYCPPTLIEAGGVKQLLIWTAKALNSLNPASGEVYWSVDLEPAYGMAIMAPRQAGDLLFAGGIGGKAVLLQLDKEKPAVKELWRGEKDTALYPVNSTPMIDDGILYGVDQPGQLRGVKLSTGARLWETTKPTTGAKPAASGTAFLVKNGDRTFLFAENGDLIIAKLSAKGYDEVGRMKLLEPTGSAFGRDVVWSHPAFANKCVFARNDKEVVCVSLAADQK
jgi:outer membrane protein assembly factor BamB